MTKGGKSVKITFVIFGEEISILIRNYIDIKLNKLNDDIKWSSSAILEMQKCGRHHQRICGSHQNNFHNKHRVKNVMKAMLESKSAAQKRAPPPRAREPARLFVNAMLCIISQSCKIRMKYKYKNLPRL